MTTFDDDMIVFAPGEAKLAGKKITCQSLGLSWPPPETFMLLGTRYKRVRYSEITDEHRAQMTHVFRGAEYVEDMDSVDLGRGDGELDGSSADATTTAEVQEPQ